MSCTTTPAAAASQDISPRALADTCSVLARRCVRSRASLLLHIGRARCRTVRRCSSSHASREAFELNRRFIEHCRPEDKQRSWSTSLLALTCEVYLRELGATCQASATVPGHRGTTSRHALPARGCPGRATSAATIAGACTHSCSMKQGCFVSASCGNHACVTIHICVQLTSDRCQDS
jgi:hypothetical protein